MRSGSLARPVGGRRHDLGRAGVGPDDRRLAAAGRSDIGAIGKRRAGSHHRQRKNDGNRRSCRRGASGPAPRRRRHSRPDRRKRHPHRPDRAASLRAGVELAVQRVVIARRIGLADRSSANGGASIIRLGRGTRRRVAMQRMHRARVFRLRKSCAAATSCRVARCIHGGGPAARASASGAAGGWYWSRAAAARLDRLIGPAHGGERIGLTDQPREFGQRIALGPSPRRADHRRDHNRRPREKVCPDIDQPS